MKRTLALGDVHGAHKALKQVLEKSSFDKEEDRLIFLGDIVDGWSESYECVEELLTIKNLITIKGNHCDWFIKWINTGIHPDGWRQGGYTTLQSYCKHLDKDLLVRGNLVYSPETCIFISPKVNSFLLESDSSRGKHPIGVSWNKNAELFMAYCRNVFSNKREFLGYFKDANLAHQAWLSKKRQLACRLAEEQDDERVSTALIERYKAYNK